MRALITAPHPLSATDDLPCMQALTTTRACLPAPLVQSVTVDEIAPLLPSDATATGGAPAAPATALEAGGMGSEDDAERERRRNSSRLAGRLSLPLPSSSSSSPTTTPTTGPSAPLPPSLKPSSLNPTSSAAPAPHAPSTGSPSFCCAACMGKHRPHTCGKNKTAQVRQSDSPSKTRDGTGCKGSAPPPPPPPPSTARGEEEGERCETCQLVRWEPGNEMLLCDGPGCERALHLRCHVPPLDQIPEGDWLCPWCRPATGVLPGVRRSTRVSDHT
jgi:hypothetical protein